MGTCSHATQWEETLVTATVGQQQHSSPSQICTCACWDHLAPPRACCSGSEPRPELLGSKWNGWALIFHAIRCVRSECLPTIVWSLWSVFNRILRTARQCRPQARALSRPGTDMMAIGPLDCCPSRRAPLIPTANPFPRGVAVCHGNP